MRFSIIIPCYNVVTYLPECVDSILRQRFSDFEIVLVDDGSTDGTSELCDSYSIKDERIRVIHQENGGSSVARNAGFSHSKGEQVVFIDSDDFIIDEHWLEKLARVDSSVDIVLYKHAKYYEDKGMAACTYSYVRVRDEMTIGQKFLRLVEDDAFYCIAWNKCFRRGFLADTGVAFVPGLVGEDIEWYLQVAPQAKTLTCLDEVFVAYRQRPGSVTKSNGIKSLEDQVSILERRLEDANRIHDPVMQEAMLGAMAKLYANALVCYSRIESSRRSECKNRLKEMAHVLRYGLSARPKLIEKVRKAMGLSGVLVALRLYDKVKHG